MAGRLFSFPSAMSHRDFGRQKETWSIWNPLSGNTLFHGMLQTLPPLLLLLAGSIILFLDVFC